MRAKRTPAVMSAEVSLVPAVRGEPPVSDDSDLRGWAEELVARARQEGVEVVGCVETVELLEHPPRGLELRVAGEEPLEPVAPIVVEVVGAGEQHEPGPEDLGRERRGDLASWFAARVDPS